MTERVRRRTSKWDLKEDPEKFPIGTRQDNASSGKASESIHDNGSIQEWNVSKDSGSRDPKWSDKNSDGVFSSEGKPRRSRWEAPSGNRADTRHDNVNRNFNGASETMRKWDENRSYSTSMSPGLDGWRQQSQSHSPKRGWSKSHRSRSRSPPHRLRSMSRSPSYHHRSRSRSPPQRFRSRSRSPLHGYKREPEWNDRIRGGLKASLCNDFARGRCRRGSQCRFLHQENNIIDDRRPSGSVPAENWESKHEKGVSYGHPDHVEWDRSKDKLAAGHDSQRNYKSSDSCINFLKGNCFRGSSCRFIHENSIIDGRGASERTHERDIKSYSGRDHRREPYRNNIPCKYFAAGNCRKGVSCTFSHEDAAHDRPEGAGTSADSRWGHGFGDENKSWGGPKWREEGVDSAHGSAEEKSLNYGSGHIAKSAWDEHGWNKKPTWNNEQALDGRPEAGSADERWVHKLGDESKSLGGPNWSDEAAGRSEAKPADERWGNSLIDENKTWAGSEAKAGDERWAHNLGNESKSWGVLKWDDEAVGQTNTRGEGRSLNEGRDHLANSGWDDPRWTEQSIGPAQKDEAADSEVKKFPQWGNEDHAGQVCGPEEVKPIGGVKWPDNTTESVVTTSDWNNDRNDVGISVSQPFQGPIDNAPNYNMDKDNRTWGVQRWTDKPSDQGGHKSPPWRTDNNSANTGLQLPGSNEEVLNFRSTASAGAEKDQYAHSSDNGKSRFGIQAPQSRVQAGMHSHEKVSTQEISCQQPYPTVVTYPEGQRHPAPTVMIHPAVSSMSVQNQQTQEHPASLIMVPSAVSTMNAQNQQTPEHSASRVMVPPAASSMKAENEQTQEPPASRVMGPPAASSMNAQNQQTQEHPASRGMVPPPVPSMNAQNQQTQEHPASRGMVPLPVSNMNTQSQQTHDHLASRVLAPPAVSSMNAQNQHTLPSAGPRAKSFDLNGPVEDLPSPNQKALFHMEETSKRAGRIDPRLSMPPINSGTSGVQSVVTSEQVAKISHLSASLAQIFGNSQQLPQLYATLNSTSSLGLVPPHPTSAGVGAPFAGSFVPPEQDAWSQKQYDPVSRSMESSQISMHPQVFPEKNMAQHESQTLLQTNVPSALGVGPDGSNPAKKETLDHKSNELKRFETVGNEQAIVKEQETAHSGDPNADEDGKKSKDTKGMRMFKFALVEFVKEILKPTWKEGQLSKEAHKTVVKKVVDKVTGSVQEDHIPQTQERIDQYMAYSKTKLTKLVEAYVEKYVKT